MRQTASDSAGWREARKEGFKFNDIASKILEDDGEPHTIKLLHKLLEFKARGEEETSGQRQAMEDISR